jgi:hypothetical protein
MGRQTTAPRRLGRASIFRGKENGVRYQGVITKIGALRFERQRARLARIYMEEMGRFAAVVSDADTIEFMARGEPDTRRYLSTQRAREIRA